MLPYISYILVGMCSAKGYGLLTLFGLKFIDSIFRISFILY